MNPLEAHRLARRLRGLARPASIEDRIAVLEEAVAQATGRTVDDLRADAARRSEDRRGA